MRVSNGDQVNRIAALALKRGKSVDFTGYLQRHLNWFHFAGLPSLVRCKAHVSIRL
jgi:hypothetical protein